MLDRLDELSELTDEHLLLKGLALEGKAGANAELARTAGQESRIERARDQYRLAYLTLRECYDRQRSRPRRGISEYSLRNVRDLVIHALRAGMRVRRHWAQTYAEGTGMDVASCRRIAWAALAEGIEAERRLSEGDLGWMTSRERTHMADSVTKAAVEVARAELVCDRPRQVLRVVDMVGPYLKRAHPGSKIRLQGLELTARRTQADAI